MFWARTVKGQVMAEYALTFFIVTASIVAMTVFVTRTFQARIYDAKKYMLETVKAAPHVGKLKAEYEPYYSNTEALVNRSNFDEKQLLPGGITGIFRRAWNDNTDSNSTSNQRPPKDAD